MYETKEVMSIYEFKKTYEERLTTRPQNIKAWHLNARRSKRRDNWVSLIDNNKIVCPATWKEVAYVWHDYKESTNSWHYNFYSEDGDMFTIDHIIPIAKWWDRMYPNVQPMIESFNTAKWNLNKQQAIETIRKLQILIDNDCF